MIWAGRHALYGTLGCCRSMVYVGLFMPYGREGVWETGESTGGREYGRKYGRKYGREGVWERVRERVRSTGGSRGEHSAAAMLMDTAT